MPKQIEQARPIQLNRSGSEPRPGRTLTGHACLRPSAPPENQPISRLRTPAEGTPCCWASSAAASQTAQDSRGRPDCRRRQSASCRRKTSRSDEENSGGVVIGTQPSPAVITPSRTLGEGTRPVGAPCEHDRDQGEELPDAGAGRGALSAGGCQGTTPPDRCPGSVFRWKAGCGFQTGNFRCVSRRR